MNTANIDTEHIHCVPAMYELTDGIKTNVAEEIVCKTMQRKILYIYMCVYIHSFLFAYYCFFWKATTNQNPVHNSLSLSSFETHEQKHASARNIRMCVLVLIT